MEEEQLFGEDSSNDDDGSDHEENPATEEGLFGGSSPEEEDAGSDEEQNVAGSDEEQNVAGSEGEDQGSDEEVQESGEEEGGTQEENEESGNEEQSGESGSEQNEAGGASSDEEQNEGEGTPQPQQSGSDSEDNEETNTATHEVEAASSDESNPPEDQEKVSNLFGDADDISSSDEEKQETVEAMEEEEEEEEVVHRRSRITDDEDEVEEQQEQEKESMETRIEVEIPKIMTDLGSAIHFVRFPNFISVEARPFDPAVYEDEIEEDELLDEEGRTRLKLKVENTMRWRKYVDENGIELLESNSRLVRWSDGSLSLHLGSEIFDVHQMSLQGDHNHLFIRQGTGLQGQAVFKTKLTFRPHSTKSATHKRMTSRLAMRHNQNQQKVRVLPIAGQDPESRKAALLKEEEDQLKAHMRREAQKRRMREKSHMRGLSSGYLEERYDDHTTNDDDEESVSALKNRFKSGHPFSHRDKIYSSDSDTEVGRRLMNAKDLSSDDDDDFIEKGAKRRKQEDGEGRKKKYIVSDEEESEDEVGDQHGEDVEVGE
nr:uncharacterized protein LOC494392 isoform X1 [Ciona intestinalis]|eukprot:XP_009859183.1 uncharacterized protein LOC494392 isoform X1 [Ciona intestinalis]